MSPSAFLFSKRFGALVVILTTGFLLYSLKGSTRSIYLPGRTTDGHYQIESDCTLCHTGSFTDREELQSACVRCHGDELARAEDSHPQRKFTDPRNADRTAVLDARYCITCHREHRPEATSVMGLSLPRDYCYRCHEKIGEERPTHRGLDFFTCGDAGCHNFHDNRALYTDFLLRHDGEPPLLSAPKVPARVHPPSKRPALSKRDANAPATLKPASSELDAWAASAHAHAGIDCTDCHAPKGGSASEEVADATCKRCHASESQGFESGRHGMRIAADLPPMKVAEARLPMKPAAHEKKLGCTSCHGAHAFDTRRAAVTACLGCHDDEHSRSYRGSPHDAPWLADPGGRSGASCATCHLPRISEAGETHVRHGQNDNLRPSDKMARDVCTACHGLSYALDTLADPALVARSFRGKPSVHVKSFEMARAQADESPRKDLP